MSRAISHTCRILFVFLIVSVGGAFAGTGVSPNSVTIKSLLKKMPRAEIMKTLGAAALSDSAWTHEGGKTLRMLLFEPVEFEGTSTLIEVLLANDSTSMIKIYLPYIGRPATRLKYPFEMADFVQSTLEDYNQMERKVEDELGIPTVLTGANFEYILPDQMQSIFGVCENGETRITIVPS
ncbi:MAG: hypothetical protein ACHQNE_08220 [Candidatus Kapaibacterium sp.]